MYCELLLDFRDWCKERDKSFIEGMTLAINNLMNGTKPSAAENDRSSKKSCCGVCICASSEIECEEVKMDSLKPLTGALPCIPQKKNQPLSPLMETPNNKTS
jgi:hypothetical protein